MVGFKMFSYPMKLFNYCHHSTQVYITMSKQDKTESKAAVDLIGAYFGKSGASWIMQVGS